MHVCSGDAVYIFFSGDDVYMFNLETLSVFMFILEMLGPLCVPIYCQAFCKKNVMSIYSPIKLSSTIIFMHNAASQLLLLI